MLWVKHLACGHIVLMWQTTGTRASEQDYRQAQNADKTNLALSKSVSHTTIVPRVLEYTAVQDLCISFGYRVLRLLGSCSHKVG